MLVRIANWADPEKQSDLGLSHWLATSFKIFRAFTVDK